MASLGTTRGGRSLPGGQLAFSLLLVSLLVPAAAEAQSSAGAMQGRVLDKATGEPLAGVTVVATSPALQGAQSEITDDLGVYELRNLPPGVYEVVFYYGETTVRKPGVQVVLGASTPVHLSMDTSAAGGEVITIVQKAPAIDSGSTKQTTKLDHVYLDNVPQRGRSYDQTLGSAAGAQNDTYGVSFSGSTSVENSYVIDGLNTTGLTYGTVGSSLLNSFIEEVEIITGGYDAEFGRSTGGVVNVVTKSGSNEFHGSVWGSLESGALGLEPTRAFVAGSSLGEEVDLNYQTDFGFEVGGPIIKDRLWFYVGFAPLLRSDQHTRVVGTQVDRRINDHDYNANPDGDGNPATSGAPGCELRGNCESDGIPDNAPGSDQPAFEEIERDPFDIDTATYQWTSKLNFALTPDHQGSFAFTGSQLSGDQSFSINGTPTATQLRNDVLTTDASLRWVSKFDKNKTEVDVVLGWHRADAVQNPVEANLPGMPELRVSDTPGIIVQGTDLGTVGRNRDRRESDRVLGFCTDDDPLIADAFPGIQNCPLTDYAWDAPGFLDDRLEARYAGKLAVTRRFRAAGHHQVKVGFDGEDNRMVDHRRYTGGRLFIGDGEIWDVNSFAELRPGGADVCDFDADGNPVPCNYLDSLGVTGETISWAAYVQDKWDILPNLRLSAGLRYEEQIIKNGEEVRNTVDPLSGKVIGENAIELGNLWAPRVGLVYDWTQEGRSKIYASYGRFYESVPMDINDRAFGGETQSLARYDAGAGGQCGMQVSTDDNTPRLPSDPNECPQQIDPSRPPLAQTLVGGVNTDVAPGLQAQRMDEIALGVEYEPVEDLTVGVAYQNRNLDRVIEDVSVDGGFNFIVANPGELDSGAEDDLEAEIEDMPPGAERDLLVTRLNNLRKLRGFDKPRRRYDAVTLTARKRFAKSFFLQGAYTYSRLEGNYPGLFADETSQLDPNLSSQYDLVELLGNRQGRLPADRPHLIKLDGFYVFDLAAAGSVTTGASFRGQSGSPRNTLGDHWNYGDNETFILPRGTTGRNDFVTQVDLRLAYSRKLHKNMQLTVAFDLLNLFNSNTATDRQQDYTDQNVDPIIDGDAGDLRYLKALDATGHEPGTDEIRPASRLKNFGRPLTYQDPMAVRLGATLTF